MKPVWVLYHASHGEGSYSLFSQGTWDISCASNVPQPKAGSWDFTLPLAPPSHPSTYTQLVSPSPCIRSSKGKSKVTLEAKDTKAQENVTSEIVQISAPVLPYPASYLKSCESKELHGSPHESIFFKKSAFSLHRSIVDLQHCINISCMRNYFPYTQTCIHSFLDSFPIQDITDY